MKKEIGKWFMDIAKYVLTAVIIGNFITDLDGLKWLIYLSGIVVVLVSLTIGLLFIREEDKKKERS